MPAPHALQPEIRTDAEHFPLLAPAWMRLFHLYDISHIKSVCHVLFLSILSESRRILLIHCRKYSLQQKTLIPLISCTGRKTQNLRLGIYFYIHLIV